MNSARIPRWLIILLLLALIVGIALWLRIALPYNQVFTEKIVKATGIDAYYYMRLVDNLVRNFPNLTQFDPYFMYPGGRLTGTQPDFFAYLIAGVVWLATLGHFDQHTLDLIAMYVPPALAALLMIATFFIGRWLGSVWVGVMAAGLLAMLPGEFLNRSLLGYTDHHIGEVFFSTIFMLFVFECCGRAAGKSMGELKGGGSGQLIKVIVCGVLAGFFLWLYMLTWQGASMFVVLLVIFQAVQAVSDHMRGRSPDYLGLLGVCVYGAALLFALTRIRGQVEPVVLATGLLVSLLLPVLSRLMEARKVAVYYYPLALAAAGLAGLGLMYLIAPDTFNQMWYNAVLIIGGQPNTTVMEMQPLLWQQNQFTLMVAFGNYMLAFLLSLAGICILLYEAARNGSPLKTLLLVWSVFILLTALGMRRFAYYYAVNVALLSGYVCWIPLRWAIGGLQAKLQKAKAAPLPVHKKKKRAAAPAKKADIRPNAALLAVVGVAILLVTYYPNIGPIPGGEKPAIDLATRPLFAPPDSWCESLDWLSKNSPEPFGSPDAYYARYGVPGSSGGFSYPDSAYSVLAWWDYGYWITRIGRRVPFSNPGAGHVGEAFFFVAQDEAAADNYTRQWKARYVIADREITVFDGKFHALASLSGHHYSDYYDIYFEKQGNDYKPVMLFYPAYYRSMVIRLYAFEGEAVMPQSVPVIRYEVRTGSDGRQAREIVEKKSFPTYKEAAEFVAANRASKYVIASGDPSQSPLPLEKLNRYKPVYKSRQVAAFGTRQSATVKIFEHQP